MITIFGRNSQFRPNVPIISHPKDRGCKRIVALPYLYVSAYNDLTYVSAT